MGLVWPEAYADILPPIRSAWGIGNQLYLGRKLSGGKSGALVYAADVSSQDFTGQAILKLDHAADPKLQEAHEVDLHRRAIDDAPQFAERHLPKLLHTLHHGDQVALLSTIAGRGLEYAEPLSACSFDRQLAAAHLVSREILEDWNADCGLRSGLASPQDLLRRWLDYRIDPGAGGRIHQFLSESCGLPPDAPTIMFQGHWYPNPLAFAVELLPSPDRVRQRALVGRCHGDLHGLNVLIGGATEKQDYYFIDLAMYEPEQYLFYDHAYLELGFLLNSRTKASPAAWESILLQLRRDGGTKDAEDERGLRADDFGWIQLVRAIRSEVGGWIDRHQADRLSFMESQYLLARVAVGLSFTHKNIATDLRQRAFVYAASNLKDYLKLNRIDWPKEGVNFTIRPAIQAPEDAPPNFPAPPPAKIDPPSPDDVAPIAPAFVPTEQARPPVVVEREQPSWFNLFFWELKRRHVVRVAGAYVVVAWLAIQVITAIEQPLNLPDWTSSLVTALLGIGFPVTCVIAWAFETSPTGLKLTRSAPEERPPGPLRTGAMDYIAVIGILAILGFSLGQEVNNYSGLQTAPASTEAPISLAVLPFHDLSVPKDEDFTDGLTIEIMNTLAQTGKFRMPGMTSVLRYKNNVEDLRFIGEALGVDYIVDGSLRRVDDEIFIRAQLVQANDGFAIWTGTIQENVDELFVAQERIANIIGNTLAVSLEIDAAELEADRTDNLAAYEYFLDGLSALGRRGEDLLVAIEDLNRSVTMEPDFAAGWAALSLAYNSVPADLEIVDGEKIDPTAYFAKARIAALRAQELDPSLPLTKHAVGDMHHAARHWADAEAAYIELLQQDANNHLVQHNYSALLNTVGKQLQSSNMASQAADADPFNPLYRLIVSLFEFQDEASDTSIVSLEDIFRDEPDVRLLALRTILAYWVSEGQPGKVLELLDQCSDCANTLRRRVAALIDDIEVLPASEVFDKYKDDRLMSFQLLQAIGGIDLVLEAFDYYETQTERRLQYFTVPWNVIEALGSRDEFQRIVGDMGLVDYWEAEGGPDYCAVFADEVYACD